MIYNLIIDNEGKTKINEFLINEEIFLKEEIDYKPIDREDFIEHLIIWIAESKNENDKYLMLNDLKYLMNLEDNFIFSSISTNNFICKSDNLNKFNSICKEILKLNHIK